MLYTYLGYTVDAYSVRSLPKQYTSFKHILYGGLNPWEFHQIPGVSFKMALVRFDHANSLDGNLIDDANGNKVARQLMRSLHLYNIVVSSHPNASDVLLLAARGLHLQQWKVPREAFAGDEAGGMEWSTAARRYSSMMVGKILLEIGYDAEIINEVKALVTRESTWSEDDMLLLEEAERRLDAECA
jgi:Domain of unknown function (DUF4202)